MSVSVLLRYRDMARAPSQLPLFDTPTSLPNGFVYRPHFITVRESHELLSYIEHLPLQESVNRDGYRARRTHMNFGASYDFREGKIVMGPPLPHWLTPLACKIAKWLHIPKAHVIEALVQEYPIKAGIGWHRDNESFEHIIGVSLLGWCTLRLRRLRRTSQAGSDMSKITLEPCSAYILQGDSRWLYQHSIPPVTAKRYSITFRTLPGTH